MAPIHLRRVEIQQQADRPATRELGPVRDKSDRLAVPPAHSPAQRQMPNSATFSDFEFCG